MYSTSRPLASSRMTWIDSRSVASVVGLPLVTRTAESPRPMPHTVRLPNISLRVANSEAVTVQSRVAGFVTIGPTMTLRVVAEDLAVDDERLLPQQVGVERPHVAEAVAARPGAASSTTRHAGRVGLQDDTELSTAPSSVVSGRWREAEVDRDWSPGRASGA